MKLILTIIILLTAMASFFVVTARAKEDFQAEIYRDSDGASILYRIHIPEGFDINKSYPLVIFLHGAGQRGNDNISQLIHGVKDILSFSKQHHEPAIIVAPQLPYNAQWVVNIPPNPQTYKMSDQPSLAIKLTIELMNDIIKNLPVDNNRIYVTGLSMGGFGTWDLIQRLPNTFAAAIPVCGGGDKNQAENIKHIPIWAFHGNKDTVVEPSRTREMISAINKAGGNPKYTEYPNVAHDSWTPTYSNQKVLKWLFSQTKS